MEISLNRQQTKSIANLLLDIAKGIFLGSFGLAITNPIKLFTILIGSFLFGICVAEALFLLRKLE